MMTRAAIAARLTELGLASMIQRLHMVVSR